jgi:hypothetical protein
MTIITGQMMETEIEKIKTFLKQSSIYFANPKLHKA